MQMDNISEFRPHDEMDKMFGEALRYAAINGVDVMAYECSVDEKSITLTKSVKIVL